MRFTAVLSLMLAFAASTSAQAAPFELTCEMTRYSGAGNQRDIRAIVPLRSQHVIDGSTAELRGTGAKGTVEDYGDRLEITYFDRLRRVGDVRIDYTYYRSTGRVSIRTRGLRSMPWEEDYPERAGKFTISGHCRLN